MENRLKVMKLLLILATVHRSTVLNYTLHHTRHAFVLFWYTSFTFLGSVKPCDCDDIGLSS